jgi:hypothetical protein
VSAGIHLDLYLTGYRKIPTVGWLFLLQVIVGFTLTIAALVTRSRLSREPEAHPDGGDHGVTGRALRSPSRVTSTRSSKNAIRSRTRAASCCGSG